ncbi:MAG TPA: iron-containing alcohol dehydrogenase [Thermoguttaceae bacterium]|nr:iron-containing alcohol dehydrogenase [Thermoguttaceae bacterium]
MSTGSTIGYDFVAPRQIVFGWGRRWEVGTLARTLGRRAFVVCGSRTLSAQGTLDEIAKALQSEGVDTVPTETISREPEVDDVDRVAALVREREVDAGDFILAIGGGAAIDLAKAVAAMATNHESPSVKDYLEGVGRGLKIAGEPLPVLAMPTTAGTGTEATKNAVISSYAPPFKKSLRDNRIMPRIALVDPELTVSVPPEITAASGMDAITQLFESYISRKAQPIPRALAMQGLRLAIPSIAEAVRDGSSREAREKMAHAALLSGLSLANSGLGMAHGVAPALGVHCRVPHGAACALMLPVALRVNAHVRQDDLARLSRALFGRERSTGPREAVERLIREIEKLCETVGVPRRLSDLGIPGDKIPAIVAGSRGSSMSGNPRELSDEELTRILEEIL